MKKEVKYSRLYYHILLTNVKKTKNQTIFPQLYTLYIQRKSIHEVLHMVDFIPRCAFMHLPKEKSSGNVTYNINNVFYGNGQCGGTIWGGGCSDRVMMRPQYYQRMNNCSGFWGVPSFVQNAMERYIGFNLLKNITNIGNQEEQTKQLAQTQQQATLPTTATNPYALLNQQGLI